MASEESGVIRFQILKVDSHGSSRKGRMHTESKEHQLKKERRWREDRFDVTIVENRGTCLMLVQSHVVPMDLVTNAARWDISLISAILQSK